MPEISPSRVPAIAAGQLFERFTTDETLNVRWIAPQEPVLFEVVNRPIADVTVRQLIIAKALDNVELRLGHMALFPFLVPPNVDVGSGTIELPLSWIWDMHASIPTKWQYLRLAKIERISGLNNAGSSGDQITGYLRLVFTAQQQGTGTEVSLFHADYRIDTNLAYQLVTVVPATPSDTNPINPAEIDTIGGYLIFRTLNVADETIRNFFLYMAPPAHGTVDSHGFYTNPTIYEMVASTGGGSGPDDFLAGSLNHGTGILVVSAYNSIPAMNSDFASWLQSANYPFRIGASRTSQDGIQVPSGIFTEFNMVVPASDEPTGDSTMNFSPVWLSAIQRVDTLAHTLRFIFSTHTILDDGVVPQVVQFASLTLQRGTISGTIVPIEPTDDLLKAGGSDQELFKQGFGAGHVMLGSMWDTAGITTFFDNFLALVNSDTTVYTKDTGRLSSYSLSRVPRTVPTEGEWDALKGSTARLVIPKNPSDSNRYVTEADQGLGDAVDFRTKAGFTQNQDIDDIGYTGGLAHKIVKLGIDAEGTHHDYEHDILPRLRCLLGRDPIFGDMWFDGTLFKIWDSSAWISI